ncbi:TetR/AcrR family transcriptional regulator [Erysipelotrichaceae bacterium OH741_COT-311]|nr:TetR/AcrR family transcriptional regulator [Erysipelotrichaceae bacterium OH741_COT-311]
MSPQVKIQKEDILEASLSILRKDGFDALNARSIAKEMQCSTKPIFRYYESMNALKEDLSSYVDNYFSQYLLNYPYIYENPLINVGLAYVDFASKEANVFRFIYLSGYLSYATFIDFVFNSQAKNFFANLLQQVDRQLSFEEIKKLYLQLLIYAHGLATLVSSNKMKFEQETLARLFVNAYIALKDNISNLQVDVI